MDLALRLNLSELNQLRSPAQKNEELPLFPTLPFPAVEYVSTYDQRLKYQV